MTETQRQLLQDFVLLEDALRVIRGKLEGDAVLTVTLVDSYEALREKLLARRELTTRLLFDRFQVP